MRKNKNDLILEYDGKKCVVHPSFSIADMVYVSECLGKKAELNYKYIIANMIASRTHSVFTAEEIYCMEDDIFQKYIKYCVLDDDELKADYDKINDLEGDEKFVRAVEKAGNYYADRMAESIRTIMLPKMEVVAETTRFIGENFSKTFIPIIEMSDAYKNMTAVFRETIAKPIIEMSDAYKKIITGYNDLFSGMKAAIRKCIESIQIPSISDKEKKTIVDAYTMWGQLGWTIAPNVPVEVYSCKPMSEKDAYKMIRKYVKDDDLENLFRILQQEKHVRKADLDEGICCFKSKNYKACSMILFSMIDNRLIRSQLDSERNKKNNRRPSGKAAANNLFKRIKAKDGRNTIFFRVLEQANIIAALNVYFEYVDDFKIQPTIINRNFLDHGMLYRRVTKKDCIKLFLLLYNFTIQLNSYEENI